MPHRLGGKRTQKDAVFTRILTRGRRRTQFCMGSHSGTQFCMSSHSRAQSDIGRWRQGFSSLHNSLTQSQQIPSPFGSPLPIRLLSSSLLSGSLSPSSHLPALFLSSISLSPFPHFFYLDSFLTINMPSCLQCQESFSTMSQLKTHRGTMHQHKVLVTFQDKSTATVHRSSQEPMNFVCVCGKEFARSEGIRKHAKGHGNPQSGK
jgi:hypothetical protein